tara:strand:- start:500 stop:1027 length:528 start_codon:yes stop_codon:yes gene_type:complete
MLMKLENGTYVQCDQREQLRVKIKAMAAEQRIIRQEENKLRTKVNPRMLSWYTGDTGKYVTGPAELNDVDAAKLKKRADRAARRHESYKQVSLRMRMALRSHRVDDLRPMARSAHLAYGFIKGRTLEQMEQPRTGASLARKPYKPVDWDEVRRLCAKFGPAGYNGPPQEAAGPAT